ncbi:MAG: hypothetical protein PHH23_01735 [Paludibacteraceae bacterium]|nr:hypothetical protein [Paludibacteraceae bacterium]
MDLNRIVEENVSDAIIEKPIKFSVCKRDFEIFPPTLGKMQILSKHYLMLDIDETAFEESPHIEAMRICVDKTDIVCEIMAVAVSSSKQELFDNDRIKGLTEFFKWNANPKDFSTVILAILTQVDYVNFISSIRLTKTLRQNEPKA